MLLHTVTVTARWNFKVISPHDGMMAKCFQHDNFCHMLISVCVCVCVYSSGILKQKCIGLVMDLVNLSSLWCDCAVLNLDNLHLIPSVGRGGG